MIAFQVWSCAIAIACAFTITYFACQPFDEAYGEYYVP